jgi:hypothetical protein
VIAKIRAFGTFWYDVVVGDDWRIAIGVTVALAITYGVSSETSVASWWIVIATVAVLLPMSIHRATRRRR